MPPEKTVVSGLDARMFDDAQYPCFALDDDLGVVGANRAAQEYLGEAGALMALLNEDRRAALRAGEAVQLTWQPLHRGACLVCVLPARQGYLALLLPAPEQTACRCRALEDTARQIQGLFTALPQLSGCAAQDEHSAQLLQYAIRQSYRLLRGVTDQLWALRLTAGTPICPVVLDLDELLRALCQAAAAAMPGCTLTFEGPGQPVCVNADRTLLELALMQLVNNALCYGATHVQVSLQAAEEQALVHVCDDGPGMCAQTALHAFDAYFSSDPLQPAHPAPGSGLGLFVAQQGIRRMGGTCALESAPGHGTQVSIALPLAAQATPAVHALLSDYLMDRTSCVYVQLCPLGGVLRL